MAPSWHSVSLDASAFDVERLGSARRMTSCHRLHLFSLDLSAEGLERAGGVGLAVPGLPIEVMVEVADSSDRDEVPEDLRSTLSPLLERLRAELAIRQRFTVSVSGKLYRHRGLGSTTQVCGLVAVGVASHAGMDLTPQGLAALEILDAGSCVGLTLMAHPTMVIDLGFTVKPGPPGGGFVAHHRVPGYVRRPQGLALELCSPPQWSVVLAIPNEPAVSGAEELAFYSNVLPVPQEAVDRAMYLTLMELVPAMITSDLGRCNAALDALSRLPSKADEINLRGMSTQTVMELLRDRFGFAGMSGLGPCVYTFTDNALSVAELDALGATLPTGTELLQFPFPSGPTTVGTP